MAAEHGASLARLAYRLTGNRADAEDLVQETYVRALRALERFTPGSVDAWLRRIATNLFLDSARRRAKVRFDPLAEDAEDKLAATGHGPERSFEFAHLNADVAAALGELAPDYRVAVVLCDLEGFSYEEIADTLGLKLGTVRSRIHRGRTQLRASLAHRDPRPPATARTLMAGR
ncbi:MAG: sigma-70 family RNA polymerase sigma factor [Arthrobacter sp.]|nr:sigma-70 family RNA polymerase sigma factor [Arthrobacter sp.]